MSQEISSRTKNLNELSDTFDKLKKKYNDFMEELNDDNARLEEIQSNFNKYPVAGSLLAQNDIDLAILEKGLKPKLDTLKCIKELSITTSDLLNTNDHLLKEFKSINQEKKTPDSKKNNQLNKQ